MLTNSQIREALRIEEKEAIAMGYAKFIQFETIEHCLDLLVSSDADLDNTFLAFDRDEREFLWVHGWTGLVMEFETN